MDDLFDFLFTVFFAVLAFWFIYAILVQGVDSSNVKTVQSVLGLQDLQDSFTLQQNLLQQGKMMDLSQLRLAMTMSYETQEYPTEEIINTKER